MVKVLPSTNAGVIFSVFVLPLLLSALSALERGRLFQGIPCYSQGMGNLCRLSPVLFLHFENV